MSVSVESGGKSGKKSVNADLNLVPYIDLLTCMVAFLLITAVWTQLARLEAHQKGQGQAGEDTPPEKKLKLVVVVNKEGFNLVVDADQQPLPMKGTEYDYERLGTELKKIKEMHPDHNDIQVASEDDIKFEIIVRTMDSALSARFPDVSLTDAGGAGIEEPAMPIYAPKAQLFRSVDLEVAKAKLGHAGRKSAYAALNLVAYIDMMTMLVIFLLMSFSATGEILFVQKNITLPDAENWADLERAPVVGVSKDIITLNGSQVATTDELSKDSATGDFKLPDLHDQLVTLKNNYKLLHPGEEFNGICVIQSDKNVEFKILKKLMYTAAVAGYQNVNFAVQPKTKGGGIGAPGGG